MKRERDPNRPRITVDAELAKDMGSPNLIEAAADALAERDIVTVFAAGKTIIGMESGSDPISGDRVLRFRLHDGGIITITGDFLVGIGGRSIETHGELTTSNSVTVAELGEGKYPGAVANPVSPPTIEGTTVSQDSGGKNVRS